MMKMKDKEIVSVETLWTILLLIQNFSGINIASYGAEDRLFFLMFGGKEIISRIAKLLTIKEQTIERYLRETNFNKEYDDDGNIKPLGKTISEEVKEELNRFPDDIRAIFVLRMNSYLWKKIGKLFHYPSEALRKRYDRFITVYAKLKGVANFKH